MQIPSSILTLASEVIGDTNEGLSGPQIVRFFNDKSSDYLVEIPHSSYPFDAPNKRTAFLDNLKKFAPTHQIDIIEELLEHHKVIGNSRRDFLKEKITSIKLNQAPNPLGDTPIWSESKSFLANYPKSKQLYDEAFKKFKDCVYERNCLDDLRLCIETFLHSVLGNSKPIEKQATELETFLTSKRMSPELVKMNLKLLEQYSIYQNRYVKHDDNVKKDEITSMFRITHTIIEGII